MWLEETIVPGQRGQHVLKEEWFSSQLLTSSCVPTQTMEITQYAVLRIETTKLKTYNPSARTYMALT